MVRMFDLDGSMKMIVALKLNPYLSVYVLLCFCPVPLRDYLFVLSASDSSPAMGGKHAPEAVSATRKALNYKLFDSGYVPDCRHWRLLECY